MIRKPPIKKPKKLKYRNLTISGKVGVGGLLFKLEPADHVEPVISDG